MDPIRTLRGGWKMLGEAVGIAVWMAATTWIGARGLWRLGVVVSRMPRVFSQTARCPRGHRVPLYGVHQCAGCRAAIEGYVFRSCRFCGSTPSWTPCPRCRLGVPNPLR